MTVVTINKNSTKTEDVTHKIGNWYEEITTGFVHVLAQTSPGMVSLIEPQGGNRHNDAVPVCNIFCISEDEMGQICISSKFELIKFITITKD